MYIFRTQQCRKEGCLLFLLIQVIHVLVIYAESDYGNGQNPNTGINIPCRDALELMVI